MEPICEPSRLEGGVIVVKAREFTNAVNQYIPSGTRFGNGQQIIVKTGIRVQVPKNVKIHVSGNPIDLVKYECIVWNQPFLAEDGELCVAVYCHGPYIHIKRGDEIAHVRFEQINLASFSMESATK